MGVEPYLISSVVNGVLGQRLVRRLCPECRERYLPAPDMLAAMELECDPADELPFFRPVGCTSCRGTGFRGRVALTEFLPLSEAISRLVLVRAEAREIGRQAMAEGMRSIFADGIAKARLGETTLEEVLRVTQDAS